MGTLSNQVVEQSIYFFPVECFFFGRKEKEAFILIKGQKICSTYFRISSLSFNRLRFKDNDNVKKKRKKKKKKKSSESHVVNNITRISQYKWSISVMCENIKSSIIPLQWIFGVCQINQTWHTEVRCFSSCERKECFM